jgi:hypothetical protein
MKRRQGKKVIKIIWELLLAHFYFYFYVLNDKINLSFIENYDQLTWLINKLLQTYFKYK